MIDVCLKIWPEYCTCWHLFSTNFSTHIEVSCFFLEHCILLVYVCICCSDVRHCHFYIKYLYHLFDNFIHCILITYTPLSPNSFQIHPNSSTPNPTLCCLLLKAYQKLCASHVLLGLWPSSSSWSVHHGPQPKENKGSSEQLSIISSFLASGWTSCLPFLPYGDVVWLDLAQVLCCLSHREVTYTIALLCLENTIKLYSALLLALLIFIPFTVMIHNHWKEIVLCMLQIIVKGATGHFLLPGSQLPG